jgi:uncharacterized protein YcbK (DUF882 family)
MIDWTSRTSKITPHFTVKEACWLPSWGVLHKPNAKERENLIRLCQVMEQIRQIMGRPISVHCMIRPPKVNAPGTQYNGRDYNAHKNGAPKSAHREGLACDFSVIGMTADDVRKALLPHLEPLQIRMEDLPGSSWVHIDLYPTTFRRYFKP